MGLTLEVCVDCADGLEAAVAGGADRIELCSALSLGGLTPSPGLMVQAAGCGVPVLAMIRPRAGGFVFSPAEEAGMLGDIAAARAVGLAGVVLGASLPDGSLDGAMLRRLVQAVKGMDLTLHRAFDLVPDRAAALELAVGLGFSRVLTSGGAMAAVDGLEELIALKAQAAGRIGILPGSGIRVANAGCFASAGFEEVHASCATETATDPAALRMGFSLPVSRRTDAETVRALKAAID